MDVEEELKEVEGSKEKPERKAMLIAVALVSVSWLALPFMYKIIKEWLKLKKVNKNEWKIHIWFEANKDWR